MILCDFGNNKNEVQEKRTRQINIGELQDFFFFFLSLTFGELHEFLNLIGTA